MDSYSSWSGIRLNVPKCCITGFMHQLQSITRKAKRDNALRGRLAHIQVSGQRIKAVSQDEPLPGTALTASLNPQAQLTWIKTILNDICKAVIRAPLPPRVRQQLLLYGAHSKIMHTHCLLALSPLAITQLDSILESACRRIWNLPACFPRTALHAPHKEWGLNLPTLWEDYRASAVRTWTTILNDQGSLGLTAKASLVRRGGNQISPMASGACVLKQQAWNPSVHITLREVHGHSHNGRPSSTRPPPHAGGQPHLPFPDHSNPHLR